MSNNEKEKILENDNSQFLVDEDLEKDLKEHDIDKLDIINDKLDNEHLSEDIEVSRIPLNLTNKINAADSFSPNVDFIKKLKKDRPDNLVTLKYISVCQYCKDPFNSHSNIPYLFKCGHFFCKVCIDTILTDTDNKIYCPEEDNVANSLGELKLLKNLMYENENFVDDESNNEINKSNIDGNNKLYCHDHRDQKLSHYVEETGEIICVYCAFSRYKRNPNQSIKEVKEKCAEVLNEVNKIIYEDNASVELLQQTVMNIKNNQKEEEVNVLNFFEQITKFIEDKKDEYLENIKHHYVINKDKISSKLNFFTKKMEDTDNIKISLSELPKNPDFTDVLENFNELSQNHFDAKNTTCELSEYKFTHDDSTKLMRYIANFAEVKTKIKTISFSKPFNSTGFSALDNVRKHQNQNQNHQTNNLLGSNEFNNRAGHNIEGSTSDYGNGEKGDRIDRERRYDVNLDVNRLKKDLTRSSNNTSNIYNSPYNFDAKAGTANNFHKNNIFNESGGYSKNGRNTDKNDIKEFSDFGRLTNSKNKENPNYRDSSDFHHFEKKEPGQIFKLGKGKH